MMNLSLIYLFVTNQNAVLALPTEVKLLLLIAFILMLVVGLFRGLFRLTKIAAICFGIYFVATFFNIL